jgi:hypothetical protein
MEAKRRQVAALQIAFAIQERIDLFGVRRLVAALSFKEHRSQVIELAPPLDGFLQNESSPAAPFRTLPELSDKLVPGKDNG